MYHQIYFKKTSFFLDECLSVRSTTDVMSNYNELSYDGILRDRTTERSSLLSSPERNQPAHSEERSQPTRPSGRKWYAWLYLGIVCARLILLYIFVQAFLMQEQDVSPNWPRDRFYWVIIASMLVELPLSAALYDATKRQPEGRRIVAARFQWQCLAHVFTFVAFFRTDTVLYARSESGYCGALLIVLVDGALLGEIRSILRIRGENGGYAS